MVLFVPSDAIWPFPNPMKSIMTFPQSLLALRVSRALARGYQNDFSQDFSSHFSLFSATKVESDCCLAIGNHCRACMCWAIEVLFQEWSCARFGQFSAPQTGLTSMRLSGRTLLHDFQSR